MYDLNTIETLSFCTAVKYSSDKDYGCDYSNKPRPCHNFVFVLEGEGVIKTADNIIAVRKANILFIPQNSEYISEWKASPKFVFHSVHFKFSPANDCFTDKKVPVQILPNDNFERLYEAVKIINKYQSEQRPSSYLYLSAFYYLCASLLPFVKAKKFETPNGSIMPAIIYLEHNHTEKIKINELAALCFLSPSRFYFLFKKQTGMSPIAYKNKLSIQKAAQVLLLHKEDSIESVALNYGFDSPIYFRRLFKKMTGKTPSAYKKEQNLI